MAKSYGQLGLKERIEIYRLQADGKSVRFIARALSRSASTVSRELKRNSKPSKKWKGGYDPQRAEELMLRRHARGRAHKLERWPELRKEVLATPRRRMVRRSRLQDARRNASPANASATNPSIAIFTGAVGPLRKPCIACCRAKSAVEENVHTMADGRKRPYSRGFPFMIARPRWMRVRVRATGKRT